jgi:hypothetical protein
VAAAFQDGAGGLAALPIKIEVPIEWVEAATNALYQ